MRETPVERDFPIEFLDRITLRESSVRKPIHLLHKWFARRTSTPFRALLMAIFGEGDPKDHFYNNVTFRRDNGSSPVILDPFMGSGTTIIEAIRLGIKAVGIDINPLAWYIASRSVQPLPTDEVRKTFRKIEVKVSRAILDYYRTQCGEGHQADVMYAFFVRTIRCENCAEMTRLNPTSTLAHWKSQSIVLCPHCGEVFSIEKTETRTTCASCGKEFDPGKGYASGSHYTCRDCGYRGDILGAIDKEKAPPVLSLFAIEFYCPVCNERGYNRPTSSDLALYERACEEYDEVRPSLLTTVIPQQEIPSGKETERLLHYRYRHFEDLFNKRQLLCLAKVYEAILEIPDQAIREFFMLTFSDALNANNMLTIYNSQRRELEPLFGGHHFWPPQVAVENNVWGTKYGRGTFRRYFAKGLKGLEYMDAPFEIEIKRKEGKQGKVKEVREARVIPGDRIQATLAPNVQELLETSETNTLLRCDTAEDLGEIPSGSVDAVVTDPPYFDNIMYSELSDFFYVWLRLGLKHLYPDVFGSHYTRKDREIVVNAAQGKDRTFYVEALGRAFHECHRVLKDDGLLTLIFQHRATEAWAAVLEALMSSGFRIVAMYPIHGESRTGMRVRGLDYNSLLVCRKEYRQERKPVPWQVFEAELRHRLQEDIEDILKRHPALAAEDAFVMATGRALQLYSGSKGQITREGRSLRIDEALESLGETAFDVLLHRLLEIAPDVDLVSKIYLSVFAQAEGVTRDTVSKLTRHGGIDLSVFQEEDLLESKPRYLQVKTPGERAPSLQRKLERGRPITYIDAAHLLFATREAGKPIDDVLRQVLRAGMDRHKLSQLVEALTERTGSIEWKRVAMALKESPAKRLEDFPG